MQRHCYYIAKGPNNLLVVSDVSFFSLVLGKVCTYKITQDRKRWNNLLMSLHKYLSKRLWLNQGARTDPLVELGFKLLCVPPYIYPKLRIR